MTDDRDGGAQRNSCDYMSIAYELNREPLYLSGASRAWFEGVYRDNIGPAHDEAALLLGSVDWMIGMLARRHRQVYVVDGSAVMLDRNRQRAAQEGGRVEFVSADWLNLPVLPARFDTVLGDNSFNFLPYPAGWVQLREQLAAVMNPGAAGFFRFFCVPAGHRNLTPEEIVAKYAGAGPVNCTAARTDILYSQWDARRYCFETERALACFEAHRDVFMQLLAGHPAGQGNDLESIVKYRGTGSVYHIPPLGEILELLGQTFHVVQVNFGPYELSQYFPLVVVTR